MAVNAIFNNFASGELSPDVWGRTDRPFYTTGLEVMRNFFPLITGPALFRQGFRYVHHTRLNGLAFGLGFEFNGEQAYTLEFTDLKMRVYKNGGVVLETAKNITGITKATPGVVTSAAHGFSNGDEVYISGIVGMPELNGQFFLVANKTNDTFELTNVDGVSVSTSSYTAYSSGGTVARVYEIATPYSAADLPQLKIAQTADLAYIVHPKYAPMKLSRTGHAAWTLATYSRTSDKFTGAGNYPGAVGFWGGRLVMGGTDNDPDMFWMSRGPDPSTGAARYDDFTVGTADTDALAFTLTSQNFTADRIYWFSATPAFLVIGSSGGLYKANGGADGAAITPTKIAVTPVSSKAVANINPIIGDQTVYVEWGGLTLRSFEYDILNDNYLAFDKNLLSDDITHGGLTQIALAQGRPDLIYATRADGVLLSCTFLSKEDVAGWARHPVGGTGAKVLSIVSESQSTGFDQVVAFVERTINGVTRRYVEYLSQDPRVPDFSDYYTGDKTQDESVYRNIVFEAQKQFIRMDSAVVLDTVQSATLTLSALSGAAVTATASAPSFTAADVGKTIMIKYLTGLETGVAKIVGYTSSTVVTIQTSQNFHTLNIPANGWYLMTSTVRGLGHLEGETVTVITDGGVHPDQEVLGGMITLEYPARYVIVGLRYIGILRTPDVELGTQGMFTIGKRRSVQSLYLRLRNTMGGKVGTTLNGLYGLVELPYRRATRDFTDRPPLLFTGVKPVSIQDTLTTDEFPEKKIYVVQDQALPMEVMSIVPTIDFAEGD